MAGNETSDFSGQSPACSGDQAPLSPDAPDLDQVERLREAYAGALELSWHWQSGRGFDAGTSAYVQSAPTGYSPETRVNIDVVLGDTEFFAGRPSNPAEVIECPDWYRVPATVTLATADGAFDAVVDGDFRIGSGFDRSLRAHADLADALGTLDLKLDPDQAYRGVVSIYLDAWNEGKRGSLELQVSSQAAPDDNPEYPLSATFPDDGCGSNGGFPIASDAPLGWADGHSAKQVLADWGAALASSPTPAVWRDCAPADVRFELGALRHVCARSNIGEQDGLLQFDAQSRLVTADGRIDTEVTAGYVTRSQLSLRTPDPVPHVPSLDFAAQSGILGVDAGNSPWLSSAVSATFRREGGHTLSDGFVIVEGLDCNVAECNAFVTREMLSWPPGESCR